MWERVRPAQAKVRKLWLKIGAAAAVACLFIGIAIYDHSWFNNSLTSVVAVKTISPGKNSATLTLADGKIITLGAGDSKSIVVGDGSLAKAGTDQLVYNEMGRSSGSENTLATADGEQYALKLPDGTEVWLNSSSSLSFRTDINRKEKRIVKLNGEAYFQVAKDPRHLFVVETNNQTIEVLGTHFNLSSYASDETNATTLLEGSVKVTAGDRTVILSPGQQATLSNQALAVKQVDPGYAVAWKDGIFMFDHEVLTSVMDKIARWYKVKVIYEDDAIKKETFFGTISKTGDLLKVLEHLELTGTVKFEVQGNVVHVSKPSR